MPSRKPLTVQQVVEALSKRPDQNAIFVLPGHDHSYRGVSAIEPTTAIQHPDGTFSEDPDYDDDGMDECFGVGEWKRVNVLLVGGR